MDTNHVGPHADGSKALKDLIAAVKVLASDTNFEFASSIVEENARLSKQIESQQAEIKRLEEKEKEQEAKKETAYREMFDMNEKERSKNAKADENIKTLQTQIQDNQRVIAELQRTKEELAKQVEEAKEKYTEEKKKVDQSNEDISGLQESIKDKQTKLDEYKVVGAKLKQKYDSLQIKLKEMETSKSAAEEDMKQKSQRLEKLESYAVRFNEETESALTERFDDLWNYCIHTLVPHLGNDIPKDQLQDSQAMRKLKMPNILHHQVPLPPSNTNAAKQMRLAVFMAILARELCENIFQPCYIFPTEIDSRDMLVKLARKDPEKESFSRAVLLAISPEEQNALLEERKKTFLHSVGSYWFDLLPSPQYEELRHGLQLVVDRACETWGFIQYSRNRYIPDLEVLDWGDGEWEPFPFGNNSSGTSQEQSIESDSDELVLAIFPRLCRVGSEGYKLVNYGTALTKSQCSDAERESKKKDPSSPRMMRANSDRPRARNMSISFGRSPDQNGSFLGGGQANS